jgi:antitoxin component YwqK of YwqJK toxin-antitoxin module
MTTIRVFKLLFVCVVLFSNCKINQRKNGQKVGRWVYKDNVMDDVLISKGRYKHDLETGIWREFANKKLVSKKKYKNGICQTINYHSNGKKMSEGISKLEIDSTMAHWFLSDEWKFYDEKGTYLGSKFYEKGTPIASTLDTLN